MFIGPVFTREVTIAPRREWTYILRSVYVGVLLLLVVTAWLVINGTQLITDLGDFARFGTMLFQFLAPVQLVLAIFFAATLAASAVGQEKERGTLLLLLMTRMTSRELVLGKLLASLLNIITMLAVSIPVFMSVAMLGGVSYYQITSVLLVTLFSMLACGSLGSCVALWRDKTFQAIATTILLMVLWIGLWETLPLLRPWAVVFSPWSAILAASRPAIDLSAGLFGTIQSFLLVCGLLVIGINAIAIAFVRVWNPEQTADGRRQTAEEDTWHKKQVEQTLEETLTFDSLTETLTEPQSLDCATPVRPSGRGSGFVTTQKPARLPMAYFILPLCLSWTTGLFLLSSIGGFVDNFDFSHDVWTLARWSVGIVLAIGWFGMLYRQNWALWLTTILQVVLIGLMINDLLIGEARVLERLLFCLIIYQTLVLASSVFALWQCSRFEKSSAAVCRLSSAVSTRHAWNNPIIWREIMTQAYGRRIWIIQFGFLAFFAMCFWTLHTLVTENMVITATQLAGPLVPLFLLSFVLVNAQAITSQTSEKDGRTFDLILASDITPKEYVFGKLGGVFYNMKWIVLFPMALCGYLFWYEALDSTSLLFLLISLIVLYAFSAMVGVYIGMQYDNTRAATATSLGTIFFLFVGIAACIWIMVAFSGSFETQLVPFSAFMIGGGIGLYVTLGVRNPSSAIATASFSLPIAVFYIITSMLLGKYVLVFAVLCGAFGFTTAAMLIPSIAEFDVATGRTMAD